jgi:hypothetical protein
LNALNAWANNVASFHGESGIGWQLRQRGNAEVLSFTIRGTGGDDDQITSSSPDLTDDAFIVSAYRKNEVRYLRINGSELSNFADTGTINYSGSSKSAIGGRYHGNGFSTPSGYLKGNLHEVIVMNGASTDDASKIEGYLADKWGLTNKFQIAPPSLSGFSTDSPTGTGKSLDLSDALTAKITTGGTEDVFDGGSAFSVSMWMKGLAHCGRRVDPWKRSI